MSTSSFKWPGAIQPKKAGPYSTQCLSFDGTDDYVSCGTIVPLPGDLTISFWFKSSSTDQGMIVGKYDNTGASSYMIWRPNGNSALRFYRNTSSSSTALDTSTAMSDGVWRHYCAVWTGNSAFVYVNGVLENNVSGVSGTPVDGAAIDFRIGRDSANSLGDAAFSIDHVALFDRALNLRDIQRLVTGTLDTEELSPIALWRLEEGTWTVAADSVGSNDGTISGATWSSSVASPLLVEYRVNGGWPGVIQPEDAAGVDTFTGTSALTAEIATLSANATFSPGTKTGTSALTSEVATLSSSGTFTAPAYTGNSLLTAEIATLSANGSFSTALFTGTSSLTSEVSTLTASAIFTIPTHTGIGSLTAESATLSASGTHTAPIYSGTSVLTSGVATLSATGIFAAAVFSGTSVLSSEIATLSSSATFTIPTYTGTSSLSAIASILTASGTRTTPTYSGTSVLTSEISTIVSSATYTIPTYTGVSSLSSEIATFVATGTFLASTDYGATSSLSAIAAILSAVGDFEAPEITGGRHIVVQGRDSSHVIVRGRDSSKHIIQIDLR